MIIWYLKSFLVLFLNKSTKLVFKEIAGRRKVRQVLFGLAAAAVTFGIGRLIGTSVMG